MSIQRRWGRRTAVLAASVSAFALVLTGCSSGGGDTDEGPSADVDVSVEYDEAQVQEIVNTALGAEVPLSEIPEEAIEAFARVTMELTDEQVQTALDCWLQPECKIGDGELHVGTVNVVDNLWQQGAAMNVLLQAMTYPEIGTVSYTLVTDLPGYQAAVRSMAANGVDAIVGYNAFGAALGPVFAEAQSAGAVVTTYVGETPELDATTINNQVFPDAPGNGTEVGELMVDELGLTSADDVAFFFGVAGNPQDTQVLAAFEESLAANDGPTVAFNQDTDWTRPGTAEAAAALIASGIDAKAIYNTYSDPMPQVVNAFDQAGIPVPPIVTWTEMNEFYGIWESRLGTEDEFELYYTNALINQGRVALSNAMAIIAGEDIPDRTALPLPVLKAEPGIYQPDLPGDYPGDSSLIPPAVMAGMVGE